MMNAAVQITGKKVVKVLGAACLATGVVALSAVTASGAAVGAVVVGFKSAKNIMQKTLKKDENVEADEDIVESTDAVTAVDAEEEINETTTAALTENTNIAEAVVEES